MRGKLVLEDKSVFYGELIGSSTVGEVVFNTGMTGYQEILTDPSYARQIITLTYPMIGNYGVSKSFNESRKSFAGGFIIGELCEEGSSCTYEESLQDFLQREKIPCLYGVDTRALTRKIRSAGTMKGAIVAENASEEEINAALLKPLVTDVVKEVTTDKIYTIEPYELKEEILIKRGKKDFTPHVVAMDFGVKQNILRSLSSLGAKLTVVPATAKAEEILALNPDGVFLSNGPGDPKDVGYAIEEIKKLIGTKPMFGICLGHQLLALAMGADTYKLKFGHRGSNQPVKDLKTGRAHISSQNHGYAVDETTLYNLPLEVTHISINDGTVEGMRHKELPIFSVQYHPEASPGPTDNLYLFDEFWNLMEKGA
ncbi:MAG: glutamine-hydrolyzing carbamoyl-phosphate synthase small subunit [Selenomonadaceae bacterium]|nr:glutamine-hydrolyzing carbamoyl-phosphate synthase small subunit [Selenomonadaceae bacterium]MBP3723360.1 glutamine-hydrolyzing carbamoyl-phosphate synthase small subunit [Selenomonadaceae bacterium]